MVVPSFNTGCTEPWQGPLTVMSLKSHGSRVLLQLSTVLDVVLKELLSCLLKWLPRSNVDSKNRISMNHPMLTRLNALRVLLLHHTQEHNQRLLLRRIPLLHRLIFTHSKRLLSSQRTDILEGETGEMSACGVGQGIEA